MADPSLVHHSNRLTSLYPLSCAQMHKQGHQIYTQNIYAYSFPTSCSARRYRRVATAHTRWLRLLSVETHPKRIKENSRAGSGIPNI